MAVLVPVRKDMSSARHLPTSSWERRRNMRKSASAICWKKRACVSIFLMKYGHKPLRWAHLMLSKSCALLSIVWLGSWACHQNQASHERGWGRCMGPESPFHLRRLAKVLHYALYSVLYPSRIRFAQVLAVLVRWHCKGLHRWRQGYCHWVQTKGGLVMWSLNYISYSSFLSGQIQVFGRCNMAVSLGQICSCGRGPWAD